MINRRFGQNFNSVTDNYVSDLKLAHYAKIPPRAVFRAQTLAVVLNTFIFVGLLNWMVANFDNGTLCTWSNPEHFVCAPASKVYATAVEYGAFSVKNFFALYPLLPWCFLFGLAIGTSFALAQIYGPNIRGYARSRISERSFNRWNKWCFHPLSYLHYFSPAVFLLGTHNWTGGQNLSFKTNALYISFVFMFYIRRRYGAWWEKYNYILEAGFDVGLAVSGIIQTLALSFGSTAISINWWGNAVATAGIDYLAYQNKAALLPIPRIGYFGPTPAEYPMNF